MRRGEVTRCSAAQMFPDDVFGACFRRCQEHRGSGSVGAHQQSNIGGVSEGNDEASRGVLRRPPGAWIFLRA
jgi:hypothetical protein